MRRLLDGLYLVSGVASAAFIVAICVVVSIQVALNFIGRILGPAYSYTLPSYADFAGFFLAAASFLGLAYTLTRGGHIRVTLVLALMGERPRFAADLFSMALGAALSAYAAWFMIALNLQSWEYQDMSFGIIAIPIWVPQMAVSAGLVILSVAFFDLFVQSLRAGRSVLRDDAPAAATVEEEAA